MKRMLVLLAVGVFAFPAAAAAKGPAAASIEGPGSGGAITITGNEEWGNPVGDLAQAAGFFPAVFRQTPDPMLDSRPKGDLGARYTVRWTVPGPDGQDDVIVQEVYPYAKTPVTYTKPGQEIFETDRSRGGWYVADSSLKETLVKVGLPATAPSGSTADPRAVSTGAVLAIAAAMALVLLGSAIVLRRRTRPATA